MHRGSDFNFNWTGLTESLLCVCVCVGVCVCTQMFLPSLKSRQWKMEPPILWPNFHTHTHSHIHTEFVSKKGRRVLITFRFVDLWVQPCYFRNVTFLVGVWVSWRMCDACLNCVQGCVIRLSVLKYMSIAYLMNTHRVSCYFTWIFFKEHFCSCVHSLSFSLCRSPSTSEVLWQGDSCQCSDECVSVYQCHMPPDMHTHQCLMTLVYNINTHSHAHHGFNVLERRWKCWTQNRELWHQCSVCVLHVDAHGGVLAFALNVFVYRCMFTTAYSCRFLLHPQVTL